MLVGQDIIRYRMSPSDTVTNIPFKLRGWAASQKKTRFSVLQHYVQSIEIKNQNVPLRQFLPRAQKQVREILWTRKGVCATIVTADHCTHGELTSGMTAGMLSLLWLAVTAVACTPAVYDN